MSTADLIKSVVELDGGAGASSFGQLLEQLSASDDAFPPRLLLLFAEKCYKHGFLEGLLPIVERCVSSCDGSDVARARLLLARIKFDASDFPLALSTINDLVLGLEGQKATLTAELIFNASVLFVKAAQSIIGSSILTQSSFETVTLKDAVLKLPNAVANRSWKTKVVLLCAKLQLLAQTETAVSDATQTLRDLYASASDAQEDVRESMCRLQVAMGILPEMVAELVQNPTLLVEAEMSHLMSSLSNAEVGETDGTFIDGLRGCLKKLKSVKGVGNEADMLAGWHSSVDEPKRLEALEVVARLGRNLLSIGMTGQMDTVRACVSLLEGASSATKANFAGRHLQCELSYLAIKSAGGSELSATSVESRTELVIRASDLLLEIQSFVAEDDNDLDELCQCICCCLWNSSLPLLQHNLRQRLKRPFEIALNVLGDSFVDLQIKLHVELAKIAEDDRLLQIMKAHADLADDLLKTSKSDISNSLGSVVNDLKLRYSRKIAIDNVSSETEAPSKLIQSFTWIERAKEVGDLVAARGALIKSGLLMAPEVFSKLPRISLSATIAKNLQPRLDEVSFLSFAKASAASYELQENDKTDLIHAWVAMVRIARKIKSWDILYAASKFVLQLSPSFNKNEDAVHAPEGHFGGEIAILHGEGLVQLLKLHDLKLGCTFNPPRFSAGLGEGVQEFDTKVSEYAEAVSQLEHECVSTFLDAAKYAKTFSESWIAVNSCVYLWNYTQHLTSQQRSKYLASPFEQMQPIILELISNGLRSDEQNRLAIVHGKVVITIAQNRLTNFQAGTENKDDGILKLCDDAMIALQSADGSLTEIAQIIQLKGSISRACGQQVLGDGILSESLESQPNMKALFSVEQLEAGIEDVTPMQVVEMLRTSTIPRSLKHQLLSRIALRSADSGQWIEAKRAASIVLSAQKQSRASQVKPTIHKTAGKLCECVCMYVQSLVLREENAAHEQGDMKGKSCDALMSAITAAVASDSIQMLKVIAVDVWNAALADNDVNWAPVLLAILSGYVALEGLKAKDPVDLRLRALMYVYVVELLALNKNDWKGALIACDTALRALPKTALPKIYCHRAICKAKLGQSTDREDVQLENEETQFSTTMRRAIAQASSSAGARLKARQDLLTRLRDNLNMDDNSSNRLLVIRLVDHAAWLYQNRNIYPNSNTLRILDEVIGILNSPTPTTKEGFVDEENTGEDESLIRCFALESERAEMLLLVHSMVAQISDDPEISVRHAHSALKAVILIWTSSIGMYNALSLLKHASEADTPDPKAKKSKKMSTPPPPDKVLIPSHPSEWAEFDFEQFSSKLKMMIQKVSSMTDSQGEIVHHVYHLRIPSLVVAHLFKMTEHLNNVGFHHLNLPILELVQILVSDEGCVPARAVHAVAMLQLSNWYRDGNRARPSHIRHALPTEVVQSDLDVVHDSNRIISQAGDMSDATLSWSEGMEPWVWWARLASQMVDVGLYSGLDFLLSEAKSAASLRDDWETNGLVAYTEARIQYLLGNQESCFNILSSSAVKMSGCAVLWCKIVHLQISCAMALGRPVDEVLVIIDTFQAAISKVPTDRMRNIDRTISNATALNERAFVYFSGLVESSKSISMCDITIADEHYSKAFAVACNSGNVLVSSNIALSWAKSLSSIDRKVSAESRSAYVVHMLTVIEDCINVLSPAIDTVVKEKGAHGHPVVTCFVDLKLHLCCTILPFYREMVDDKIGKLQRPSSEPTIEEVIAEYTKLPDDIRNPIDVRLERICESAGTDILGTTAALLCGTWEKRLSNRQIATASYLAGTVSRLTVSLQRATLHRCKAYSIWDAPSRPSSSEVPLTDDNNEYDDKKTQDQTTVENLDVNTEISKISLTDECQILSTNSIELLKQAATIFIELDEMSEATSCFVELAESCGASSIQNSRQSANYISFMQSCLAANELQLLWLRSLPVASQCVERALVNAISAAKHSHNDALLTELKDKLKSISNGAQFSSFDVKLMKENNENGSCSLPSGVKTLVLQHSQDRKWLYAGVLSNVEEQTLFATRVSVDALMFQDIVRAFDQAKLSNTVNETDSFKNENEDHAHVEIQKEIQDLNIERKSSMEVTGDSAEATPDDINLDEAKPGDSNTTSKAAPNTKFEHLLDLLNAYLEPALHAVQGSILDDSTDNVTLIIAADSSLLGLPLEMLNLFQNERLKSTSRDFSLHTILHRFKSAAAGSTESTPSKKKGKGATLLETIQVDASNLDCIIDSAGNLHADARERLISRCNGLQDIMESKLDVSKWITSGMPEPLLRRKQINLLKDSKLVMYCGPQLLRNSPGLSRTDYSACQVAVVLTTFFSRSDDRSMTPFTTYTCDVEVAAMLSMRGVLSVVTNAWDNQLSAYGEHLDFLFGSFGNSVGSAMQDLRAPLIKKDSTQDDAKKKDKGKKGVVQEKRAGPFKEDQLHSRFAFFAIGLPHIALK